MSRLRLRNDFWNRHGANIASCWKEIYGRRLFQGPKKIHSGERSMLFRCIFIMNGLDDVNTMELFVFFRITTRSYVMKYTDEPLFLPKAY